MDKHGEMQIKKTKNKLLTEWVCDLVYEFDMFLCSIDSI